MSAVFETGHARNVAALEEMISICLTHGTTYNPSKITIRLNSLQTLLIAARAAVNDVSDKLVAYTTAANNRQSIFEVLKPLATRLVNALSVTDATAKTISDAKAINRKIQGSRAIKKTTTDPKPENNDNKTTTDDAKTNNTDPKTDNTNTKTTETAKTDNKSISVSQQSYDQQIEHFQKLILLLSTEVSYMPNEIGLQIPTLTTILSTMRAANSSVINATTTLSSSRIGRNDILYKKGTGLYDISLEIKKYIKSVFGTNSAQYRQISGVKLAKSIK